MEIEIRQIFGKGKNTHEKQDEHTREFIIQTNSLRGLRFIGDVIALFSFCIVTLCYDKLLKPCRVGTHILAMELIAFVWILTSVKQIYFVIAEFIILKNNNVSGR